MGRSTIPPNLSLRIPPSSIGVGSKGAKFPGMGSLTNNYIHKLQKDQKRNQDALQRCVENLPLQIRQVVCSDDSKKQKHRVRLNQKGTKGIDQNYFWDHNVSQDMKLWLRESPRQNQLGRRQERELSPIFSTTRKKRQKRLPQNATEKRVSFPDYTMPSIVTDSSYKSDFSFDREQSKKSRSTATQLSEQKTKYKYGKLHSPTSDRTMTNRSIMSTQTSVLDEIEFQKRYRKVHDLNNHIHFVHSNFLKGRRFNKRTKLPPLVTPARSSQSEDDDGFDLYVIKSVQRYNQPQETPRDDKIKSKDVLTDSVHMTDPTNYVHETLEVPKLTSTPVESGSDTSVTSHRTSAENTPVERDQTIQLFLNPPLGVHKNSHDTSVSGQVFLTNRERSKDMDKKEFEIEEKSDYEKNFTKISDCETKQELSISVHIEYKNRRETSTDDLIDT